MCHVGVGWCGSCRGGVGFVVKRWGGLSKISLNNFMSQLCVVFSSDKLLSTAYWIMWEKTCFCWQLLWQKAFQFH